MKYSITFLLFLLFINASCTNKNKNTQPEWVDQYNIVWNTQSLNSSESMPLGGGDIGCNVWVENGEILLYIQRSGSLSENGEYLKLGRIRISLSPNPFTKEAQFRQELKLRDGFIEIEAKNKKGSSNLTIKIWVDVFLPVVHFDIQSESPVKVCAAYENWRFEDKELLPGASRERFSCFNLEGYPGKVIREKDLTNFEKNGILFYHRNPEIKLIPEVLIKQQGLESYAEEITDDIKNRTFGGFISGEGFVPGMNGQGSYQNTPYHSWSIVSESAGKSHELIVASHIEQTETIDDWKQELLSIADKGSVNTKESWEKTSHWWNEFWNRSRIVIFPDNPDPSNPVWQMSRNYQLFRYQLACNVFGEYPTKFNGGNFTFDPGLVNEKYTLSPDWRAWGGAVFTAQNQRLLYWPMLKSGDFDAILPQFELYRKGLPGATARVELNFKHKGALYSEYTSVPGTALGAGWGWNNTNHRQRGEEVPFGDPQITGLAGYDKPVEKGIMANPSIAYHWESQVEHAYMILEYHRFTGLDISKYMPFIKSALVFFDEHYQIRQEMRNGKKLDEHGKLVIYPSTSCESYRGAKNPADLIAGLRACLHSLLELDEYYLTSSEKDYYRGFLRRIPDYTFSEVEGKRIIQPAESWLKESNSELPQFYPLFPFNQFEIGDTEIQSFINAYHFAPESRKGNVISWHQDGIFFARMGMVEEAATYNTKKLQDSQRRFPTFWGPGHDWVPDHNWGGSGMIGLQEMLMQTIDGKILLFPAWPKDWDVSFKLHAPQNTIVEGQLRNGKLINLTITPSIRKKDVHLFSINNIIN